MTTMTSIVKRVQDKVAIITGGASGIGKSTARLFAQHGAKVIVADVQDELGQRVCEEIGATTGQPVSYVHCDVTSDSDVERVVDTAVSVHGKLDVMFNNAGITGLYDPRISSLNREDFKKVFDVNVYGAFLGAKHAARVMTPAKKGCILFSASAVSVTYGGVPHPYLASKHAVVGLTKNLAVELGKQGIRVNCISPWGVPTPLTASIIGGDIDKETIKEIISGYANIKGVKMDESDVADAALYLASDESKYVSGLNLVVDGGYTLMCSTASTSPTTS